MTERGRWHDFLSLLRGFREEVFHVDYDLPCLNELEEEAMTLSCACACGVLTGGGGGGVNPEMQ